MRVCHLEVANSLLELPQRQAGEVFGVVPSPCILTGRQLSSYLCQVGLKGADLQGQDNESKPDPDARET